MGVTNQEFISRAELGRQPGPGEHDPRNDVLTSAKRAEALKHANYDAICEGTGSTLSPFALETTGGHGASSTMRALRRCTIGTCSCKSKCATRLCQPADGGRAAGQVQDGHLVRATPGHDRPSDYPSSSCPRRLRLAAPGFAWLRLAGAPPRMRSSSLLLSRSSCPNRRAVGDGQAGWEH